MSKPKPQTWTREPWQVACVNQLREGGTNHMSLVRGEKVIASTTGYKATEEDTANMRRAAACVNACAGLDDPAAPRQQRDDLLAACRQILDAADYSASGGAADLGNRLAEIEHEARAAIAAAKQAH